MKKSDLARRRFAACDNVKRCRYCVRVAEDSDRRVRDRFPATPTVSLVDRREGKP
jgi:hypothetical protein